MSALLCDVTVHRRLTSELYMPVAVNRLYWIDAYMRHNFDLVMSLLAMSLELRFCASRRVGQGEVGVGEFQHWAQVTWLLPAWA